MTAVSPALMPTILNRLFVTVASVSLPSPIRYLTVPPVTSPGMVTTKSN